jgi:hypothetical protein
MKRGVSSKSPKSVTSLHVKFAIVRERHRVQAGSFNSDDDAEVQFMLTLYFCGDRDHNEEDARKSLSLNMQKFASTVPKCRRLKTGCKYMIMPHHIIGCIRWLEDCGSKERCFIIKFLCKDLNLGFGSTLSYLPPSSVFELCKSFAKYCLLQHTNRARNWSHCCEVFGVCHGRYFVSGDIFINFNQWWLCFIVMVEGPHQLPDQSQKSKAFCYICL